MKLRAIAVCLLVGCTTAHADRTMPPEQVKRTELLETLATGREFQVNKQTYQLLPEVFAVERTSPKVEPRQALEQVGIDGALLIEARGKFVMYRSQARTTPSGAQQRPMTVFPTVLNKRTKVIGVLHGTLIVKPNQMADAAVIGSTYGLEVVKEFPQIQTVIYRAQRSVDVIAALSAVGADPRVASVYPEIIEHERVPY